MSIIIAETFKKDFIKIFKGTNDINIFIKKLKTTKLLRLEKPFIKYKLDILSVSVRGILIFEINKNFIPLFIIKKNNKKYGMNLIITNELKKILENNYIKILSDIKNNKFEIY